MDTNKGFGSILERTMKKIKGVFQSEFQKRGFDLTVEQWVILEKIYESGQDASQADVSHSSFRNRATTSRIIAGLCKKGLVEKSRFKGDLKRFKLVITEKGHKVLLQIKPVAEKLRKIGYTDIDDKEFDIFMKVLDQLWHKYDSYEA